jgi:uncharacterized protein YndB with AHSA1/START domain
MDARMTRTTLLEEARFMHLPVEWVFQAFTSPHHLRGWLGLGSYVIGRPGGAYWIEDPTAPDGAVEPIWLQGLVENWTDPAGLVVAWPQRGGAGRHRLHLEARPVLGGAEVNMALTASPSAAHPISDAAPFESLWHNALGRVADYFTRTDLNGGPLGH